MVAVVAIILQDNPHKILPHRATMEQMGNLKLATVAVLVVAVVATLVVQADWLDQVTMVGTAEVRELIILAQQQPFLSQPLEKAPEVCRVYEGYGLLAMESTDMCNCPTATQLLMGQAEQQVARILTHQITVTEVALAVTLVPLAHLAVAAVVAVHLYFF